MNRIGVVTEREFLSTVRRTSYLIVTFGMPFFAALYFGLFALVPAYVMSRTGQSRRNQGIVNEAAIVRMEYAGMRGSADLGAADPVPLTRGRIAGALLEEAGVTVRFRLFPSRQAAIAALAAGAIGKFYLVPADYVATGRIETYEPDEATVSFGSSEGRRALERLLSRSLLAGRLPNEIMARAETPIDPAKSDSFLVRADGRVAPSNASERLAKVAIPGVFAILLLISLMTSAGYLLHGLSEEKESRVIEVILASVRPHELLFGKLLGLGAAGLLQLAVWVSVGGFSTSFLLAAALAALDWRLFLGCLVFFILGFLMIGSLMTGTGMLGSSARESQQFAAIWSLAAILPPAMTWMVILDDPNGGVARAIGWFPLSAPITMMLRLGTGKVPAWDLLVAIALLAAAVWLSIRASAALLRVGLLTYGRRPALREIIRQVRRGGGPRAAPADRAGARGNPR